MSKNKTSRYFKYAIGEIILVVIGILIALQINNWNENRKASQKERHLFNNLKIDFKSRLVELEELLNAKENGIKAIHALNNQIQNAEILLDSNKLNTLLSKTVNGYLFNEQFKMLDVLFYTGLINDIKNEDLKRQLIEWPQKVEEMLEEQRAYNGETYDEHLRILKTYVPLRAIYETFEFRGYELPKGQPIAQKADYKGLMLDSDFENSLAEQELLIHIMIIDNKALVLSAKQIIEQLEIEYQ